ncbi:MAG: LPS assembly lipoprotein LptE [Desulfurivibrionaceae bacterium]
MLLLSGCGYSNPYIDKSKGGQVLLHVEMWKNQTAELGYQANIHKQLIYWLNKSPGLRIVGDPDRADYIISGVIQSANFPGQSYDEFENVQTLRVEISFSYEVKKARTGQTILSRSNLVKRGSLTVSDIAATTEGNKRLELDDIADDMADEIYVRLFHELSRRQQEEQNNIMPNS